MHRKAKAIAAAQKYAPKPEGSALTYGLIGVVLAVLGIISFGLFYQAPVFSYPLVVAGLLMAVFVFSIVLRFLRKRRHMAAFEREYDRHDNSPPSE